MGCNAVLALRRNSAVIAFRMRTARCANIEIGGLHFFRRVSSSETSDPVTRHVHFRIEILHVHESLTHESYHEKSERTTFLVRSPKSPKQAGADVYLDYCMRFEMIR